MEIEEKLDLILTECKHRHSRISSKEVWDNIAFNISGNKNVEDPFLRSLIIDLKESGYIHEVNYLNSGDYMYSNYRATIQGLTFEGFVNRKKNEISNAMAMQKNQEKQQELEKMNLSLQISNRNLTAILAILSGVAALYYLLQIMEFFAG